MSATMTATYRLTLNRDEFPGEALPVTGTLHDVETGRLVAINVGRTEAEVAAVLAERLVARSAA